MPVPDSGTGALVWSDEFSGPAVDPARWTFETGNNNGWGNQELQSYQAANAEIRSLPDGSGQALVITARKEANGTYTSARLKTQGKASWTHGRIEARMRLPEGQGIWPAFWMLGESISQVGWPACGEIDIMEMIGGADPRDRQSYGTLHWSGPTGKYATEPHNPFTAEAKLSAGFHVYSIDWTATRITWSVDGRVFATQSTATTDMAEFRQPQFLLLNLAVGGRWPGYPDGTTVFPQEFWIDWIRVYENR